MESSLNRDINSLSLGIGGFCRTKRFVVRTVALCLAIALIIGTAVAFFVLRSRVYEGKVYVFAYHEAFYRNYFYKNSAIKELLAEKDLSNEKFETASHLVLVERKNLTDEKLAELSLSGKIPSAAEISDMLANKFFCVILDKNGELVYSGTELSEFAAALERSGF